MLKVRKGKKKADYVSRAIPILMAEGLSQKSAIGKAYGMYETKKRKK
jgi:hypothetical protein